MKNVTQITVALLLLLFGGVSRSFAQCNQGTLYGTGAASGFCTTTTTSIQVCHYYSEYAKFTGLTIGNTYEIGSNVPGTTSGNTFVVSGQHILTMYDGTGSVLASQVNPTNNLINLTFVATTTEVRVQVNTYAGNICGSAGSYCHYFGLRCLSCSGPGAPACATTPSPSNNATGVALSPTFSWTAVTNASSYDVYISDPLSVDCSSTAVFSNPPVTVTTNSYTLATPLTGNTYYKWYVIPKDCTGTSGSSCTQWCFRTMAPPPSNDNCSGALNLTVGSGFPCTPTNAMSWSNATASSVTAPACGSYTTGDVWFTFTLASNATVIINTAEGTGGTPITDGAMSLYSGTCGSLTEVECDDDDGPGSMPQIRRYLTAGTYFIRLWDYSDKTSTGIGGICVNTITPLANDNCSGVNGTPIVLTPQPNAASCSSPVSATTVGATQSNSDCSPGGTLAADDVWFQFTTGAGVTSQTIRFQNVTTVFGGSVTSMALNTYAGTCGAASANCNTTVTITGGSGSVNLTGLTANTTYYLRVWTNSDTDNGATFDICVIDPPPMSYVSSAVTQQTGNIGTASNYQKILQLAVTVVNTLNPLSVTQLDFSTSGTPGTSQPADLANARVYYTGTTSTFTDGAAAGTQFGVTISNPNGVMTFTGSQTLTGGSSNTTNYFWLVYDLSCSATGPNIDASVVASGLKLSSGGPYTPTTADPSGSRTVIAPTSYTTAANGNWSDPASWACGIPPASTTATININHDITLNTDVTLGGSVIIAAGKTLTVNTNTFNVGTAGTGTQNLTINGTLSVGGGTVNVGTLASVTTSGISIAAGGTLSLSSGTVNLGPTGGGKRALTGAGTGVLNVSGGTLNVNGSMSLTKFTQSGGDVNVDGNAAGVSGNSVGSGVILISLTPAAASDISWTGGMLTIVDPHANSTSTDVLKLDGTFNGPVNVTTGHTIRFGNGVSTDAGGSSSYGFRVNTWATTSGLRFGNVIIEGPTGTNRFVNSFYQQPVQGDFTVNTGGECRISNVLINGNLTVNTGGIFTNTGTLSMINSSFLDGSNISLSASANAQTISGGGVFRNLTSSITANLTNLTINNSNPAGVTISTSTALTGQGTGSVSGTLTLTSGKLNNVSPLTLGTGTGNLGTLTGGTSTAYITGEFRRWNASGTGTTSRIFPIGSTASYQPCSINFTGTQTTGGVISALFTASDPGTNGLPLADGGITCTGVSPSGYWTVERLSGAGGTYTADMNASGFTGSGNAPITLLSSIRLLKAQTIGPWINTDGTPVAPSALSSVTRTGCITFSKFAIGGTSAALPLELASFTGKTLASSNMLFWETLSEKNVQDHIVERSADGITWTEIGRKHGQTDSQSPLWYELEDRAPLQKAYYRLRSVDFDGSENLSASILLTRKNGQFGITAAFPSPAKDKLTVQFSTLREGTVTIRLHDITGRLVLTQEFSAENGLNEMPLSVSELQPGVYLLDVYDSERATEPVRIVKQ